MAASPADELEPSNAVRAFRISTTVVCVEQLHREVIDTELLDNLRRLRHSRLKAPQLCRAAFPCLNNQEGESDV